MQFGSPEFVLAIVGMAMIAGVLKSWGRAKHGVPDYTRRGRRRHAQQERDEVETLRHENATLRDRLEASEDRLAVLERIVTDKSYSLASEIEALRGTDEARSREGTL